MKRSFRQDASWHLLLGGMLLGSLLLRVAVMPLVIPGSGHDDQLMIGLAKSIADGNWLGEYGLRGHLTLAKPPGFPLFVAATSWLPGHALIWAHVLVLVGACLVIRAMSQLGFPKVVRLIALFFVAYFPPLFGDSLSRLYRESFLAALVSLACGLSLTIIAMFETTPKNVKSDRRAAVLVALLACIVGVFIITKPGWYSLLPLLALSGLLVLRRWTSSVKIEATASKKSRKTRILRAVLLLTLIIVPAAGPSFVVKQINEAKYGVKTQDTFASGPFVDALNQLTRIQPRSGRTYVLVDAGMRAQAYRVSPTFRALRPFLERKDSEGWNGPPCGQVGICDESAGWFIWDLRDAVQASGHGDSAGEFQTTLSGIAKEISTACAAGRLDCGPKGLAPGVLSPSTWSIRLFVNAVFIGARYVWNLPNIGSGSRPPLGVLAPETRDLWEWATKTNRLDIPEVNYDPTYFNLSAAVQFNYETYLFAWRITLIISIAFMLLRASRGANVSWRTLRHSVTRTDLGSRLVGVAAASGFVITVLSLVALEVSSGVYLRSGGDLYLPAAFPFLIVAVSINLKSVSREIRSRTTVFPGNSEPTPTVWPRVD